MSSGNPHHVAESRENEVGLRGERQTIINTTHGKNANGATGTVNEFHIGRKQVFQTEAVDGMRMAAAYFHDAIMPLRIGEPPDFLAGFTDEFRSSKFVHELH